MTRFTRIVGLRPTSSRIELSQTLHMSTFGCPAVFYFFSPRLPVSLRSTVFPPYWTYSNPSHVNLRLHCGFLFLLAKIASLASLNCLPSVLNLLKSPTSTFGCLVCSIFIFAKIVGLRPTSSRIELTQTLRTSTFGCPAVFLLIRLPE